MWTFTLKDNIFYQDGTPIKAQDFKFAIERSFDPAVAIGQNYHRPYLDPSGQYQGVYKDPAGLKSIQVPDDKTIVFHLSKPLAGFPDIAATAVFTPFPADKVTGPTSIDQNPIASGLTCSTATPEDRSSRSPGIRTGSRRRMTSARPTRTTTSSSSVWIPARSTSG